MSNFELLESVRRSTQARHRAAFNAVVATTAFIAAGAAGDASANGNIMTAAGGTACADCHADTAYSYNNLYSQIKALAATGAGTDAWATAIKACGTGVFGATGSCATTPPPDNQAPSVTATPPAAVVEPAAVSFTVTANDPDGDAVAVAASGSLNGTAAADLYDDATRTFKWEPSTAGSYSVTFTPTDAKGLAGAATTVQITVDPPSSGGGNDAPVLTKPVDGSSFNATVGTALTIPVAATDKNGDTVKLSYTGTDGSSGSIPASFDAASGAWAGNFQWTPASAAPAEVSFTFTATDAPGDATVTPKSSSVSVTVKVTDNGGGGGSGNISAIDITRSFWSRRGHKLFAAGTVTAPEGTDLRGQEVTVTDSDSGEVIGTAKIKRRNTWKLKKRLEIAPCSITASVGDVSATDAVSRAPSDCGSGSGGGDGDDDHHDHDHHGDGDDHHGRHDD